MLFLAALLPLLALALPQNQTPPTCTDGGKLQCCQATFTGDSFPLRAAADAVCYNLTPAVLNCILTDTPIDSDYGCVGEYACCQVNDLEPLIGLFCSKPPGDCTGPEAGQPPYCLDVIDRRFGNCSANEVHTIRADMGLGPLVDDTAEELGKTLPVGEVLGDLPVVGGDGK